jgi:hypothetical protein
MISPEVIEIGTSRYVPFVKSFDSQKQATVQYGTISCTGSSVADVDFHRFWNQSIRESTSETFEFSDVMESGNQNRLLHGLSDARSPVRIVMDLKVEEWAHSVGIGEYFRLLGRLVDLKMDPVGDVTVRLDTDPDYDHDYLVASIPVSGTVEDILSRHDSLLTEWVQIVPSEVRSKFVFDLHFVD